MINIKKILDCKAKCDKRKVWAGISALIFIVAIGGLFTTVRPYLPNFNIDEEGVAVAEIEARLMVYLEESIGVGAVSIASIQKENGLYKVELKVQGQDYTSYATLDGGLLFPQAIDINEFLTSLEVVESEAAQQERPDVKLFVMSYCPFGVQAVKGILPAWELLQGKADIGMYFVDYVMHDKEEIDENLRQYCIDETQPDKLIAYLDCFTKNEDSGACFLQANIDGGAIASCVSAADDEFGITTSYEDKDSWLSGRYPKFNVHADLNTQYDVGGSPTLVINDEVVQLNNRSPRSFQTAICDAFIESPIECSEILSEEAPTAGFGGGTSDNPSSGTCE